MYFDMKTNPFFKPASTMDDDRRIGLINHFQQMAVHARQQRMMFESYVLYALLRGADIRKTSHLPDGENALSALRRIRDELHRHRARVEKWEKPVMNHFVQALIGTKSMKRGLPVGMSKDVSEHLTIQFADIASVIEQGIAFYEGLDQATESTSAA